MNRFVAICIPLFFMLSCMKGVKADAVLDELPDIFPDYVDVTIPAKIAPLCFELSGAEGRVFLTLESGDVSCTVKGPEFKIRPSEWRRLTSTGCDITATVTKRSDGRWLAFRPFTIYVSRDPIDESIAYRLIEPAYETWNTMGLYMRNLSTCDQTAMITNEGTDRNCMNCHSFASRDASRMVFHMRAVHGGTYLVKDGGVRRLDTKTDKTISAAVYPQWSADGRFIAFSVNDIAQAFHSTVSNRIEVYDSVSDVVVMDVESGELFSSPLLMQEDVLETYPTFSPDGKTLYFCSSPRQEVPDGYRDIRYCICSVSFNPEDRSFGSVVDTLYNASSTGLCAVFPRVSPDGRWLMFTQTAYGCFSIWHKDSDLWMIDLRDGSMRRLEEADSPDVDSYHSWSSNGRWVVFSSRRMDGLYTRPFIMHVDEDGNVSKPFVLPQASSSFYRDCLKSFNIPEFVNGRIPVSEDDIIKAALGEASAISFAE